MPDSSPLVAGFKEWVGFPDWNILKVKAKLDSGAKTSAINAFLESLQTRTDGTQVAVLRLQLSRRHPERTRRVETAVIRTVRVRNTGGELLTRLVVEAVLRIGPIVKKIELTVADRARMLTPLILGRRAIQDQFLIDVGRKFVLRD